MFIESWDIMNLPQYKAVAAALNHRITTKQYPPHTKLPDQVTLAKEFGVSRITIREACDELEQKDLIWKKSGSGTFVLNTAMLDHHDQPNSWFAGVTTTNPRAEVSTQLLNFSVSMPSPKLQAKLKISADAPIYIIDRLRKLKGIPHSLEHNIIPVSLAPGLTPAICEQSLYDFFRDTLKVQLSGAQRHITAVLANAQDILYLHVATGDPILSVEQVTWITTGERLIYADLRNLPSSGGYVNMATFNTH